MSLAARWLLGLLFVALTLFVIFASSVGIYAFRLWSEERATAKEVSAEVTRLEAAGHPTTYDDLNRPHRAADGAADTTSFWLAALTSFDPMRMNKQAKGIPYVGDGDPAMLPSNPDSDDLRAAEEFLAAFDATLQATLLAASQRGECRFPVEFQDDGNLLTPDAQNIRSLVRLLALNVHVQAIRGETGKALDSLLAMYAASEALSHQQTILEHLIRLSTLGSALSQTQLVINELELTDEQLARLAAQLAGMDLQASFTRGLIGERALVYQQLDRTGPLNRTAARDEHLKVMRQAIDFSSQPPHVGRTNLQALSARYGSVPPGTSPLHANKYVLVALMFPSLTASFDAYATAVAHRDTLVTGIAAQRYNQKTGRFPAQLTDLVPDYLPSIPLDPFNGQPLHLITQGNALLIYSIGRDNKDNGGQTSTDNSPDPDIVVRIKLNKP
jgi:hypothetical protein